MKSPSRLLPLLFAIIFVSVLINLYYYYQRPLSTIFNPIPYNSSILISPTNGVLPANSTPFAQPTLNLKTGDKIGFIRKAYFNQNGQPVVDIDYIDWPVNKNSDTQLVSLVLSPRAEIICYDATLSQNYRQINFYDFATYLDQTTNPFWVDIMDDQITRIYEQYQPSR